MIIFIDDNTEISMILGKQNSGTRKWITFKDGEVILYNEGESERFSFVESRLRSVHTTERNYSGERVTKWEIDMEGETEGETYSIVLPYNSGAFKSIVLALASYKQLSASTKVKIAPFKKGNFTNVAVWADGAKLDWAVRELPPIEEVKLNGKAYKDETKRMELISSFVSQINQRLQPAGGNQ